MAQKINDENGIKKNSDYRQSGGSSARKPTSAPHRKSSQGGSQKKLSNGKSFNLKGVIASITKAPGINSDNLRNKPKAIQKKAKQKNPSTRRDVQKNEIQAETRKQEIKIGETLDTSKMEPLPPTTRRTQRNLTGNRSTHSDRQRTTSKQPQWTKSGTKSRELTFSVLISEYTRKIWFKIIIVTFAILLAMYVVYQAYLNYYTDVKTEIAVISTYSETIDTEGISIRDESLIDGSLSSTTVSAVENGAKVSKDQTIINIFNSSQAAAAYKRIAEIDEEISELQSMATISEDSANEVNNIEKQLDEQITNLAKSVNDRNLSKISDIKGNLTYLMNKRLVAMRQVEDYQDRIESLNEEKQSLESTYSEKPSTITARSSGYYVNSLDGYENLLNTSMLSELTVSSLNNIMEQVVDVPENSAGKLIMDFTWYLACPVSAKEAEDYLAVNSVYTLILPYSETGSMQGTLAYLNKGDNDQYLAIFRCNSLLSELCNIRRQPVKIQIRSYTGFNIKKSALHINVTTVETKDEDGNVTGEEEVRYPCVYTIVGNQVVAKRVNILYNGDKVIICSSKENGSNYLSLYDEVITEGKGLHAGKIIN